MRWFVGAGQPSEGWNILWLDDELTFRSSLFQHVFSLCPFWVSGNSLGIIGQAAGSCVTQLQFNKEQQRRPGPGDSRGRAKASADPNEVPREDADGRSAADEQRILQPEAKSAALELLEPNLERPLGSVAGASEGNNVEHWDFRGAGLRTGAAELMVRFSRTVGCDE